MPTYDYACALCGHVMEVVHGVHETGPTVCPQCGGPLYKRLSPPAIHFRGSGWAKMDARDAASARTAAPAGKARAHGHDGAATPSSTERSGSSSDASSPAPGSASGGEE